MLQVVDDYDCVFNLTNTGTTIKIIISYKLVDDYGYMLNQTNLDHNNQTIVATVIMYC